MFQALYGGEGAQRREAVALETPRAQLLYHCAWEQLPGLPSQRLWRGLGLPPGLQVLSVNPTFISK